MYGLRAIIVLFVLFALLFPVFVLGSLASDEEGVALSAISGAEDSMSLAYQAVLEAESAGGNASGLLDRLDLAAGYLATANMCLREGDFEGAVGNASLCVGVLEGLVDDAEALRDKAVTEPGQRSLMTLSGSVVGVVVVVCASYLGWSWFKKRYCERVLKMKPEVVEGES